MAKFTFNMPDVGEGVAEAEIVAWQVKVGDRVEEDQHLVDVMTDKATIDIESPVTGVVTQVAGEVGDTIAVGSMLLVVEVEGEVEEEAQDTAAPAPAPTASQVENGSRWKRPMRPMRTMRLRPIPSLSRSLRRRPRQNMRTTPKFSPLPPCASAPAIWASIWGR